MLQNVINLSHERVPLITGIPIFQSKSSKRGGHVFVFNLSQPYPVEVSNEDPSSAGEVCYFSYVSFIKIVLMYSHGEEGWDSCQ